MAKCAFSSFTAEEAVANCRGGCCRSPPYPQSVAAPIVGAA